MFNLCYCLDNLKKDTKELAREAVGLRTSDPSISDHSFNRNQYAEDPPSNSLEYSKILPRIEFLEEENSFRKDLSLSIHDIKRALGDQSMHKKTLNDQSYESLVSTIQMFPQLGPEEGEIVSTGRMRRRANLEAGQRRPRHCNTSLGFAHYQKIALEGGQRIESQEKSTSLLKKKNRNDLALKKNSIKEFNSSRDCVGSSSSGASVEVGDLFGAVSLLPDSKTSSGSIRIEYRQRGKFLRSSIVSSRQNRTIKSGKRGLKKVKKGRRKRSENEARTTTDFDLDAFVMKGMDEQLNSLDESNLGARMGVLNKKKNRRKMLGNCDSR